MQIVQAAFNKGKTEQQLVKVLQAYDCMGKYGSSVSTYEHQMLVHRTESLEEAQLRWQKASLARSFHGAIFGAAANHRQVTAFDIAIGGGKAASNPLFYKYMCAVADWRLKKAKTGKLRPSILEWNKFLCDFAIYWSDEPQWRKDLIEGNANYYSTGILPASLPRVDEIPSSLVFQTLALASLEPRAMSTLTPTTQSQPAKTSP
jgi:hypothetical protein